MGIAFAVAVTDGEERQDAVPAQVIQALPAYPLAQPGHPSLLAWRKANAAREDGHSAAILGADTIVVLDDAVLGKPRDPAHARQMLRQLSGRTHRVYTGIVVLPPATAASGAPVFDLVAADVRLAALSDAEIADYVATGEPLDKAGSYGIQGLGGRLVEQVNGSFTAVVGLPLPATAALLQTIGIALPVSVDAAWRLWRQTLAKEPLCIRQSMC
jgi:septum formation protein